MSRSPLWVTLVGLAIVFVTFSLLLSSQPGGQVLAPEPPAPARKPMTTTTYELSEAIEQAVIRSIVHLEVPGGGLFRLRP